MKTRPIRITRSSIDRGNIRRGPVLVGRRPRRNRRLPGVATAGLVMLVITAYLAAHATDAKASPPTVVQDTALRPLTTTAGGPTLYVVMPHPATGEQRRLAHWLSGQLRCAIVQDASAQEVGVRGVKS